VSSQTNGRLVYQKSRHDKPRDSRGLIGVSRERGNGGLAKPVPNCILAPKVYTTMQNSRCCRQSFENSGSLRNLVCQSVGLRRKPEIGEFPAHLDVGLSSKWRLAGLATLVFHDRRRLELLTNLELEAWPAFVFHQENGTGGRLNQPRQDAGTSGQKQAVPA
jgi:hypothetical protein